MKTLNRRTLLRGAGGVGIALPFLDAMWPARAAGPDGAPQALLRDDREQRGGHRRPGSRPAARRTSSWGRRMAPLEPFKANLIIPDGLTQDAAGDHRRHRPRPRRRQRRQRLDLQRQERHRRRRVDRSGAGQRHRRQLAGQVADHRQQGLQLLLLRRRPEAGAPGRARSARRTSIACSPASPRPPPPAGRPIPAATADLAKLRARDKSILDAAMEQYTQAGQEGGTPAIGSGWRSTWRPSARSSSS